MIKVDKRDLITIRNILEKYVPWCEARVFGSRIKGKAKPYSDIDIALVCPTKIGLRIKSQLRYAFEESDLPYRVDIVDWKALSKDFIKAIGKYKVIKKPSHFIKVGNPSYPHFMKGGRERGICNLK
jgi:predicted nucleotidyltransferase